MRIRLFCILLIFVQPISAGEYIFQHTSGYEIRVVTPKDTTLIEAVHQSTPVQVIVISNNPEQEQINTSEALAFVSSPLFRVSISSLRQGQGQGTIIGSFYALLQLTGEQQTSSLKSTQELSTRSMSSNRQKAKLMNKKKVYPCSFPACDSCFVDRLKRAVHHRTHLSKSDLEALKNNEKIYCPYCKTFYTYMLQTLIMHISKQHK